MTAAHYLALFLLLALALPIFDWAERADGRVS